MAASERGISKDTPVTGTTAFVVACFLAISLFNFIELNFIILTTFKRRSGLYFWSFILATWGIPPYAIGFLLKSFRPSINSYIYVTLIVIGWWPLVTGQAVVLYSRLHLILHKRSWLRAVLLMIIINAIIGHVPTTILVYGANSSNSGRFTKPYSIYEKIQITIFFLQEMAISGLYIWETTKMLRITALPGQDANRNMLKHLVAVSIIVAALDAPVLALGYAGLYYLQTSYKVLAYSTKLKLEFSILNRLVDIANTRKGSSSCARTERRSTADQYNGLEPRS
ncbi:hypothetical protein AK830_g9844 [Neonectria ditissima]|uniref:DUF7703 domain-containing protein n=1 Tax=Neonectria ditissima TaxID=78410 RepID=A0A0P7B846_9HYPO|nr:hypothetical protein AK830_g9844 [Neonectria ditissima]